MSRERLLERLKVWEEGRARRGACGSSPSSIVAHLLRLLNTRQGNVPIGEEYGVPDFQSMLQSFPDSVLSMERALLSAIERYEPRLQDVQVRYLPDQEGNLALRFQIVAKVVGDPGQRLTLESTVDLYGRVRLEE